MHTIAFSHSCDLLAILAILHKCQPLTTNTNYLLPIIIKSAIIRMHTIAFFTTPATCWHRQNPHNCKSLTTNTLWVNLPWYSHIFKIFSIFSNIFEILPYCHIVRPVLTHSPPFFLPREDGETKRLWVIKWISLLWNFWQLLTNCEAQIMALMRMTLTFFLE